MTWKSVEFLLSQVTEQMKCYINSLLNLFSIQATVIEKKKIPML